MSSLWKERPGTRWLLALIGVAGLCLGLGLSLPVVTFERLVGDETYSVLTGIADLGKGGNVLLAVIVLSFSVVFPIAKLGLLVAICFGAVEDDRRRPTVHRLSLLGKWSMLDVFVIAILLGAIRLGVLAEAEAHSGIYFFAAGILLTMASTLGLALIVGRGGTGDQDEPVRLDRWREGWITLVSAGLFVAGLSLPLMDVQKWTFWDNEFSALEGTWMMARRGQALLALAVLFFVVALPLLRYVAVCRVRWGGSVSRRALRRVLTLDEWAMLDVYVLALLIVVVKIDDIAGVHPRAGMWMLFSASVLSVLDSWRLRAAVHA